MLFGFGKPSGSGRKAHLAHLDEGSGEENCKSSLSPWWGCLWENLLVSSEKHIAHHSQVIYCTQNVYKGLVSVWETCS